MLAAYTGAVGSQTCAAAVGRGGASTVISSARVLAQTGGHPHCYPALPNYSSLLKARLSCTVKGFALVRLEDNKWEVGTGFVLTCHVQVTS